MYFLYFNFKITSQKFCCCFFVVVVVVVVVVVAAAAVVVVVVVVLYNVQQTHNPKLELRQFKLHMSIAQENSYCYLFIFLTIILFFHLIFEPVNNYFSCLNM